MDTVRISRIATAAIACVLGAAVAAAPAEAQQGSGLTVALGAAPYDLSGTGTELVVGASADLAVAGPLVVEPGLRYFRYTPQGGGDVGILFPELTLQVELPVGGVRPYLGAGAGGALVTEGRGGEDLTLHAAVGARIPVAPRWSIRPEFRVRSVDPFTGSMGDATLGLRYGL